MKFSVFTQNHPWKKKEKKLVQSPVNSWSGRIKAVVAYQASHTMGLRWENVIIVVPLNYFIAP